MATFTEQNYQDIVDILNLRPEQLELNSTLRTQGRILEEQDARLTLDNVTKVTDAITAWQGYDTAKTAAIATDDSLGVSSQSVSGEYSVSWANGASSEKYANYDILMRKQAAIITRYLDLRRFFSQYTSRTGLGVSS